MKTRASSLINRSLYVLLASVLVMSYMLVFNKGHAFATPQFNKTYVRLDDLVAQDTGVSGRACFVPQTTTAINSIELTFPTTNGSPDYTLNTTASNWSLGTSNLNTGNPLNETGVANLPVHPTSVSGSSVEIDLTSAFTPANTSTNYCFNWSGSNTLQVPSAGAVEQSPGILTTYSSTGASGPINTTQFGLPQTISTTGYEVSLTATVPPIFSMQISTTSDSLGNLSISNPISSSGVTTTLSTNAANGWILWIKDNAPSGSCGAKGGLYSSTKNYCIKSSNAANTNEHAVINAEHYISSVTGTAVGSNGTCSSVAYQAASGYAFDGITQTPNWGGVLSNSSYLPMAACNGTATGSTVVFTETATIVGATPAATDYGDTLFLTGAGEF